jgi:aspartate 1-decarboxylase
MYTSRFVSLYVFAISILAMSCKKSIEASTGGGTGNDTIVTVVVTPPVDPPTAGTIGFFLNDWVPKTFVAPSFIDTTIPASASTTVTVNTANVITKVAPTLFGNNTNLWSTQMVTESSLMNHITNLHPNILRAPGGSISDIYFWNAPKNTAPADAPASLLDANGNAAAAGYWSGKNDESWTLSLDNYYNVLQQTNSKGIITVNYGYARYGTSTNPVATAAHLAADWVRYDRGRTKYWEVGNETYGDWEAGYRINTATNKDGQPQIVTGDLYGRHFKVFADSMHKAAVEIGATIYVGATMVEAAPQSWNTTTVKTWNTGLLSQVGNSADFYIVHNYYTPYNANSNATEILSTATTVTATMMNYTTQTLQSTGLPIKPIALTEWNIFAAGSKQNVSHIAGVHATMVLGELIKNKYGEASRWDLANGWDSGNDHGLFNNGDEPDGVAKWNPRPAFYHMYFFQKILGDRCVGSSVAGNASVDAYASSYTSGQAAVTLVNKSDVEQQVEVKVQNFNVGTRFYWYTLVGGNDNGEFSRKVFVNGKGPSGAAGGPVDYPTLKAYSASAQNGIRVTLPARSVVNMMIDKK